MCAFARTGALEQAMVAPGSFHDDSMIGEGSRMNKRSGLLALGRAARQPGADPHDTIPSANTGTLSRWGFILRVLIAVLVDSLIAAPSAMAQSRGELLYTTHCISCHTTEMHWRDKRSASNWASLKVQVRRWQGAASLAWSDGDILDVSRYLNESIYHFEQPADAVSSLSPGGNEPVSRLARLAPHRLP